MMMQTMRDGKWRESGAKSPRNEMHGLARRVALVENTPRALCHRQLVMDYPLESTAEGI